MDQSGQEKRVKIPVNYAYLLDTCAWLHIFDQTPAGNQIQSLIATHPICTTLVVIAELTDKLTREKRPFLDYLAHVKMRASIAALNEPLAISGALAKQELRRTAKHASLNDGINLATARALHTTLLTADQDFTGVNGAIVV